VKKIAEKQLPGSSEGERQVQETLGGSEAPEEQIYTRRYDHGFVISFLFWIPGLREYVRVPQRLFHVARRAQIFRCELVAHIGSAHGNTTFFPRAILDPLRLWHSKYSSRAKAGKNHMAGFT